MILTFKPIYFPRVWGGSQLSTVLSREIESDRPIGESWDIVDRKDHQSIVDSGKFIGQTLDQLIKDEYRYLMGPNWDPNRRFPILVKWLDCAQKLSLQVHPPARIAESLGGEPKTENWYIAHTSNNSSLYIGLKKGVTKSSFEKALENNDLDSMCHKVASHSGESILVESGRIHAIGGGNLILEIQQNSDTTYRVYDWGRKGLDGKERELHIDESLLSIDFDDFEPSLLNTNGNNGHVIAECEHFRIRKFCLSGSFHVDLKSEGENCAIIHSLSKSLTVSGSKVQPYSQALSPFGEKCWIESESAAEFLVTDHFSN